MRVGVPSGLIGIGQPRGALAGPGWPGAKGNGSAGSPYLPEALALFDRMSSEPDVVFKGGIDAAYRTAGYKTGIEKLAYFGVPALHDEQGSLLNWVGAGTATKQGTLTFTPRVGVVSGGNGNWIDSGLAHSTVFPTMASRRNATLLFYVRAQAGDAGACVIGVSGATDRFRFSSNNSSNITGRVNDATGHSAAAGGVYTGLFAFVRTGATSRAVYRDGVMIGSVTTTATDEVNAIAGNIGLFRNGSNYVPDGAVTVCGWGFGAQSITTDDMLAIKAGLDAYLAAVGPRYHLLTGAGQSNMRHHWAYQLAAHGGSGNGTPGTTSADRIINPALLAAIEGKYTDGRSNVLISEGMLTAFGGSAVLNVNLGSNYWLDYGALTDGDRLTDWKTYINGLGDMSRFSTVYIAWAQGELESVKTEMQAALADWSAATQIVFGRMRAYIASKGFTGTVPIVVQPLGTVAGESAVGRLDAMRAIQLGWETSVPNLVVAPSILDAVHTSDGVHYEDYTIDVNGMDLIAARVAATLVPLVTG